jgi:hypothetical protein
MSNPTNRTAVLAFGRAFGRLFFPAKILFSATTLLDLVVLLTHVNWPYGRK